MGTRAVRHDPGAILRELGRVLVHVVGRHRKSAGNVGLKAVRVRARVDDDQTRAVFDRRLWQGWTAPFAERYYDGQEGAD